MKILVAGALAWNPERFRSLHEQGHSLWGLWSKSMSWDQGPYPVLGGVVRETNIDEAPRLIREQNIDCVYCLFQEYDPRLFAAPSRTIKHDISTLIRQLMLQRERGAFDVPIVRHWGFDIHQLDPDVALNIDAHIFCNREKFYYFTQPRYRGGCGLNVFPPEKDVTFLDSDRPKEEFMNDNFSSWLSDSDGEIHTVCIGRPFGIDYLDVARHGIHVHIYGNNYDNPSKGVSELFARVSKESAGLRRFIHFHPSLQTIGTNWNDVRRIKSQWVPEFSRYDAGWSYIGDPIKWKLLENRAAIPNRLSTYLLAGIPIIVDRRLGFYRYNEPHRLSAAIEFRGDYAALRESLEAERGSRIGAVNAKRARKCYSFDSTIDPLIGALERARREYFSREPVSRRRFCRTGQPIFSFGWGVQRARISHRARAVVSRWIRYVQRVLWGRAS